MTRAGKKISGIFTGLSVHLQPARQNAPTMSHPDEMYVDIGATSEAEVRAAGVDLLDPVALERFTQNLGTDEVAGPAIGDRFGCSVLIDLLRRFEGHKANVSGTLTVAFATQQWTGGRGLDRLLNELHPDELIYVGRLTPPHPDASKATAPPAYETTKLGGGVLVATSDSSAPLSGLAAELRQIGDEHHVAIHAVTAALPAIAGYVKPQPLPNRFVHLGVSTLFSVTPAETISIEDVSALKSVLYQYFVRQEMPGGTLGGYGGSVFGSHPSALRVLTETYGASGHEGAVREQVKKLLPSWAQARNGRSRQFSFENGKREGQFQCEKNSIHRAFG
jgi:putative aminopeptidase FrvX